MFGLSREKIADGKRIDLFDLNFYLSQEQMQGALYIRRSSLAFILRPLIYFLRLVKYGIVGSRKFPDELDKCKGLLYSKTDNNSLTVLSLVQWNENYIHLNESMVRGEEDLRFPSFWVYFFGLFFVGTVLEKKNEGSSYSKKYFWDIFDRHLLTYGYYSFFRELFSQTKPPLLLVSNDHSLESRSAVKAALEGKIPTVYVQHASVGLRFPPLNFDYAFLDGMDALLTYDQIGPSATQCFLIGSLKLDSLCQIRKTEKPEKVIGLCLNHFDNLDSVTKTLELISKEISGVRLILRPHPLEIRKREFNELIEKYHGEISNPKKQSIQDFLERVNVNLAGESGVHIEALQANVPSFYVEWSDQIADYFGFLKSGHIKNYKADDLKLVRSIEGAFVKNGHQGELIPESLNYAVNKEWEGKVVQLLDYFLSHLDGIHDHAQWERVEGVKLKAWRLKGWDSTKILQS